VQSQIPGSYGLERLRLASLKSPLMLKAPTPTSKLSLWRLAFSLSNMGIRYWGCRVRCPRITPICIAAALPGNSPVSFSGLEDEVPIKRHVTVIIDATDLKITGKCFVVLGTCYGYNH